MSKKELGLEQLAEQIKGEGSFTIPETVELNTVPDDIKIINDPETSPKKDDDAPDILHKPIDISDAVNKPQDNIVPPVPEDTDEASLFAPFANVLMEQGVLNKDLIEGGKLDSINDLVEVMRKQIANEATAYSEAQKQSLSPKGLEYLQMIEKGVNPENALNTVNYEEMINGFTDEALNDVEVQKQAISLYLKGMNIEDSEITDQLQYMEDMNKLSEKAKLYSGKLKASIANQKTQLEQQAVYQKQQQAQQLQTELDLLKKKVYDVKEIVPGKVLNDSLKDQVFTSMTTAVGTDPNSGQPINAVAAKRLEDPHGWEMKVHYLNLLGVFDDNWDGILNSVKTDAVKDFEKALSTTSPSTGTQPVIRDNTEDKTKDLLAGFAKFKQALNNK